MPIANTNIVSPTWSHSSRFVTLPGGGDIYNRKWGAFAADLLLWVPSIVWAVPQGYITAEQINKKATIAHYTSGPGRGRRRS